MSLAWILTSVARDPNDVLLRFIPAPRAVSVR